MEWFKVKVLGKGTFGLVTLAVNLEDPTLPSVAIKSARLQDSSTLKKEKRVLEDLEGSPHVIMFLADTVSVDPELGTVYDLFLEFAAGGTLSDLIRNRGGCLRECEVQEYTRMILKGLSGIHKKGYVHCDLKPANILIVPRQDGTNCLKIADFGLTKEPGEEMQYGNYFVFRFRGTPIYMSPESYLLGYIDSPLDIWSLGCIVVEMLTGKPAMPWVGGHIRNLATGHAFVMQEPCIPQDMSDMGKAFLKKCFARDPRERWTAEMLLNHPYVLPGLAMKSATTSSLQVPSEKFCLSNKLGFKEIKQQRLQVL